MSEIYIVWNGAKSEGFVTDDLIDAQRARDGIVGSGSTLGIAFAEAYEDDDCTIEKIDDEKLTIQDYEEVLADKRRLVRELDVAINGDDAAQQASLCDLVATLPRQFSTLRARVREMEEAMVNAAVPLEAMLMASTDALHGDLAKKEIHSAIRHAVGCIRTALGIGMPAALSPKEPI